MNPSSLCQTPGTELARAIREKTVSPVEVTEAFLDRIATLEPRLNAFATLTAEHAREEARRAEDAVMKRRPLGLLHGVPFGLKDFANTAGIRTAFGSRILEKNIPKEDAEVVSRLRRAGGVLLGKTTGPEYGWKALGDSPLTGETRNPWNTAHSPGGSSSGSAAAVASGMAPLAVGSDGAGSIRIPASFCGLYGFKPSFGRIPVPLPPPHQLTHFGPLTRTVADAAVLMAVMSGPHESDPASLEAHPADYIGKLNDGVRGLKVAWSPDLGHARVDPEVARICAQATQAFEQAGALVEEVNPGWADPRPILDPLWLGGYAARLHTRLEEWGSRMDPGLVTLVREGARISGTAFAEAQMARIGFWDVVRPFFHRYDLLLTPTVSVVAL
ncbi:MAG: amidase family protein, partial [Deltaproteobacteria bacterium]|nr:amidase family protein [Deltaproteobacteria bacterium]